MDRRWSQQNQICLEIHPTWWEFQPSLTKPCHDACTQPKTPEKEVIINSEILIVNGKM